MLRLIVTAVVILGLAATATASLSSCRNGSASFGDRLPPELTARLAQGPEQTAKAHQPKDEFVITERTEIQLDGQPCKYTDIPRGAAIVLLEVASDGRTVLKVHFRTAR